MALVSVDIFTLLGILNGEFFILLIKSFSVFDYQGVRPIMSSNKIIPIANISDFAE